MLVIILTIILTGQKRFLIYPIFTVLLLLSNITKKQGGRPSVVEITEPCKVLTTIFLTHFKTISRHSCF